MHESNPVVENYLTACDAVADAFRGMDHEMMVARPVPGKWTALEVLCHLVDTDLIVAARIRAALISDSPRLPAASLAEMTTILAGDARDAAEEIKLFQLIRAQTARIIRSMPTGALDRSLTLLKPGGEEVTRKIGEILTVITAHVTHHLAFVVEKRRALGLNPQQ
jgi:uncharacterized damage-inducible protein DinB